MGQVGEARRCDERRSVGAGLLGCSIFRRGDRGLLGCRWHCAEIGRDGRHGIRRGSRGIRDGLGLGGAQRRDFRRFDRRCQDWHYAGVCRFAQRKTAARFGRRPTGAGRHAGPAPGCRRRTRGRHRAHGRGRPQRICLRHGKPPRGSPRSRRGTGITATLRLGNRDQPQNDDGSQRRHSKEKAFHQSSSPKTDRNGSTGGRTVRKALSQTDASTPARKNCGRPLGLVPETGVPRKVNCGIVWVHGCIRGIAR